MSDKVQLIKEEIERRYNCEKCYPNDREANVAAVVLQELLLFIDSLQEEPTSEDLEGEIKRYLHEVYDRDTMVGDVARHFAEWQKQAMKDALQTEYEKGRFDMKEKMMKKVENVFHELYLPKVKYELFKQYMEQ